MIYGWERAGRVIVIARIRKRILDPAEARRPKEVSACGVGEEYGETAQGSRKLAIGCYQKSRP